MDNFFESPKFTGPFDVAKSRIQIGELFGEFKPNLVDAFNELELINELISDVEIGTYKGTEINVVIELLNVGYDISLPPGKYSNLIAGMYDYEFGRGHGYSSDEHSENSEANIDLYLNMVINPLCKKFKVKAEEINTISQQFFNTWERAFLGEEKYEILQEKRKKRSI